VPELLYTTAKKLYGRGKKYTLRGFTVSLDEPEFSAKFIIYMLERSLKTDSDLVDQLFNSSEKLLARALLILARYGKEGEPETIGQNIAGDSGRTGRDHPKPREFLYEQIQEARFHSLQRRTKSVNVVLHD
jgi:CRP/FNR family cyclic AMP-dependent transcriptional regulator